MVGPRDTSVRYPARKRAPYGAAAFLVGYLTFLPLAAWMYRPLLESAVFELSSFMLSLTDVLSPKVVSTPVAAGHLFYNSQFVPLSIPVSTGGEFTASVMINLLLESGGAALGMFIIPAVLYTVAGALATRDIDTTFPMRGAKKAALLFTGTAPLALIGAFLLRVPGEAGVIMPSILWATFSAGVIYPAFFGGVGGYLAVVRSRRRD